jgi:hypothetical protein
VVTIDYLFSGKGTVRSNVRLHRTSRQFKYSLYPFKELIVAGGGKKNAKIQEFSSEFWNSGNLR